MTTFLFKEEDYGNIALVIGVPPMAKSSPWNHVIQGQIWHAGLDT